MDSELVRALSQIGLIEADSTSSVAEKVQSMARTARQALAAHDAREGERAQPVVAERRLAHAGVFKGEHGLRGLLDSGTFWERQPYGTRLYYGDGIADYLHRSVLRTAVELLDSSAQPQPSVADWVMVPREPTPEMRNAHKMYGDTSDWWNSVLAVAPQPQEAPNV